MNRSVLVISSIVRFLKFRLQADIPPTKVSGSLFFGTWCVHRAAAGLLAARSQYPAMNQLWKDRERGFLHMTGTQMAFDFASDATDERSADGLDLAALHAAIDSGDAPIAATSRSIAGAILAVYGMMIVDKRDRRVSNSVLMQRVRMLRELQRTLIDGEGLSRRDSLDISGPKFRHLLERVVGVFGQALIDSGLAGPGAERVLDRFAHLWDERLVSLELELRAGTSDTSSATAAVQTTAG